MTPTPKKNHSDREWTTADEIAFLTKLGTGEYSTAPATQHLSRTELLRRYVASCSLRTEWTGLQRSRIEAAATRMLRHLTGATRAEQASS